MRVFPHKGPWSVSARFRALLGGLLAALIMLATSHPGLAQPAPPTDQETPVVVSGADAGGTGSEPGAALDAGNGDEAAQAMHDPVAAAEAAAARAGADTLEAEQNLAEAIQFGDPAAIEDANMALDRSRAGLRDAEETLNRARERRERAVDVAPGQTGLDAAQGAAAQDQKAYAPQVRPRTTTNRNEQQSGLGVTPRATRQGPDDIPEDAATRSWNSREQVQPDGQGRSQERERAQKRHRLGVQTGKKN
ncbi:hypothetical protein [Paucidesulfovibrio longus]|uniref:hypothetical protein n=1 Tax=Paucidesulfovibrio longus TaxID=889 RepID=UPI0003FF02CE|nr:hypothetical protein [Paucidesulfovibrio longus]